MVKMNKSNGLAAKINFEANPFPLRANSFHSTSLLERRRRTHWDSASSFKSSPKKSHPYSKRISKQHLLHSVSQFAEHLFQSWRSDKDKYDQSSSQQSTWYRPNFREDDYGRRKPRHRSSQASRRDFSDIDDDEFETIFRAASGGGKRHFYRSFTDSDPQYMNFNYKNYYNKEEYEYDSSSKYEKPVVNLTSERLTLGLSSSGPLNLEDVKNAYRTCALKWHPDRHQGSSKVVAEEKFKVCSAAYQSLSDELARE